MTGASSGIGAEFARALRARGEAVVLVARRADRLASLSAELGGEPHAVAIAADLAHDGAASKLKQALDARGIAVDGLVNCAGLGRTGPFASQPPEAVRAMCDVNVRALVELTRAFLPPMLERGRGRIVNVASNAAFQPIPFLGVYAATKSFVLSFTGGPRRGAAGKRRQGAGALPGDHRNRVPRRRRDRTASRRPSAADDDAGQVVAASLAGLDGGQLRVVVGFANRLLGRAQRFVPGWLARGSQVELYRDSKRDVTPGERLLSLRRSALEAHG